MYNHLFTLNELFSYYQEKVGEIDNFNIENIYIVDDLQKIADAYNIKEQTNNMDAYTIPINNCIVVIKNNLD